MSKKNKKKMKEDEVVVDGQQTTETSQQNAEKESAETVNQEEANEQPNAANEEEVPTPTEEEKLMAALAESEAKLEDLHDKYLRQMAEFENYRKRTLKEKSELVLNGSANLMMPCCLCWTTWTAPSTPWPRRTTP